MARPLAAEATDMSDEARRIYEDGRNAMSAGRFGEAVMAFEQSARLSEHFKTLELLGECLIQLGEFGQAVASLERAAALNVQVRARSLLAEALLRGGDVARAAEVAASVLLEAPTNRKALAVHQQASRTAG